MFFLPILMKRGGRGILDNEDRTRDPHYPGGRGGENGLPVAPEGSIGYRQASDLK